MCNYKGTSPILKSQDPKMKQTLCRITEEAAATASKGAKVPPLGVRQGDFDLCKCLF